MNYRYTEYLEEELYRDISDTWYSKDIIMTVYEHTQSIEYVSHTLSVRPLLVEWLITNNTSIAKQLKKEIADGWINYRKEKLRSRKIAEQVRCCPKYREWYKKIVERDNNICQTCKSKIYEIYINRWRSGLEVDHIVPIYRIIRDNKIKTMEDAEKCEILWDIKNGRCLCHSCHIKTDTWGRRATKK